MIILLPYPNMELSPNRKNGKSWKSTKAHKDLALQVGYIAAKQASNGIRLEKKPTRIEITFVQSDKRRRDLDNLLSASKPTLDGVATALGIDDKFFEPMILQRLYIKEGQSFMQIKVGE